MAFERISIDHQVMGGVPCIRGTRIPVTTVVSIVAEGVTVEAVLADFPQLGRTTSAKFCATPPLPLDSESCR